MEHLGKFKRLACAVTCCVLAIIICIFGAGCFEFPEGPPNTVTTSKLLKDVYKNYFSIGAAINTYTLDKYAQNDLMAHFNSITAENEMKWHVVEPAEGQFSFGRADDIVTWAQDNDVAVRGHTLLWHKSLPSWLANKKMTKKEALALIDNHVTAVMTHFGDSIYAWDVCNEALRNTITDEQLASGDIWRTEEEVTYGNENSSVDWYKLCGTDFIKQAFISADRVRTELGLDVKLYYNDYNLNTPNKRQAVVKLVQTLRDDGVPIDGIGMQAHYRLPNYLADPEQFMYNFEESIKTFTELGLDVQITELDIQVYESSQSPQAYDTLPLDVEIAQAEMFGDIYAVCRKYAAAADDNCGSVTNVTTWGVADANTYATTSIHREFPLLFSVDYTEKRAYYEVITF